MYRSSQSSGLSHKKATYPEKHKQILKQLLKEDGNKVCVDCKTSAHPRWASWNLGCFICIRCSGIHRSMGVHISKVKSVDLDAWTDEQVEQMVKWGNNKCNSYWEAKLPDGYVPDQLKIENFIRTKYDLKKWVASSKVPDPMSIQVEGKPTAPIPVNSNTKSVPDLTSKTGPAVPSKSPNTKNLLDDDFGSFTTASAPVSATSTGPNNSPVPKPIISGNNAALPSLPIKSSSPSIQNNNTGRPDLKKSILSLYSSPSSSNSSFVQPSAPSVNVQRATTKSPDALANSLDGLSFTNSSSTVNSQPKPQSSWNNEWTESLNNWSTTSLNGSNNTQSSFNSTNNTGLDDDLFKNVWN